VRCAGAGRDLGGDSGSRAEAGIKKALLFQPAERGGIEMQTLRLVDDLSVRHHSEPLDILDDAVDESGSAAPAVDILDPQQERAAHLPGQIVRPERGISVAEVQPAGR
jgi:hypothetical protein